MDFKRYVFHGETKALKLAKKTSFLPLNMCIKSSDFSDYLHVSFKDHRSNIYIVQKVSITIYKISKLYLLELAAPPSTVSSMPCTHA